MKTFIHHRRWSEYFKQSIFMSFFDWCRANILSSLHYRLFGVKYTRMWHFVYTVLVSHKNVSEKSNVSRIAGVQGSELQVHRDRMDETSDIRRRCSGRVQSLRERHRRGNPWCRPVVILIHQGCRVSRICLPSSGHFLSLPIQRYVILLAYEFYWDLRKLASAVNCHLSVS